MRYSSSAGVRSALPMRSQASLKHSAEKNRWAAARSKGGGVMKISGPLRDGAQRRYAASHRSGLLVYRGIGGGGRKAGATGPGMGRISIRRATAGDAAVVSLR